MWFFCKKKVKLPALLPGQWLLVPLGNPGDDYTCTRHNLGRLMIQRWMDRHVAEPVAPHSFHYGKVYYLNEALKALVPTTYMNLSGKVIAEAVKAGISRERMLVIYDDKDLPLGRGKLSINGSSADHRGIQSIMDELDSEDILRLRLGISPFQRPLSQWVLEEWTDQEWETIENMDAPFARFMSELSENPPITDLQSRVNAKEFWIE